MVINPMAQSVKNPTNKNKSKVTVGNVLFVGFLFLKSIALERGPLSKVGFGTILGGWASRYPKWLGSLPRGLVY